MDTHKHTLIHFWRKNEKKLRVKNAIPSKFAYGSHFTHPV